MRVNSTDVQTCISCSGNQVVAVACTIALTVPSGVTPADWTADPTFASDFDEDIGAALNISSARVVIISIVATGTSESGQAAVEFVVLPDASMRVVVCGYVCVYVCVCLCLCSCVLCGCCVSDYMVPCESCRWRKSLAHRRVSRFANAIVNARVATHRQGHSTRRHHANHHRSTNHHYEMPRCLCCHWLLPFSRFPFIVKQEEPQRWWCGWHRHCDPGCPWRSGVCVLAVSHSRAGLCCQ